MLVKGATANDITADYNAHYDCDACMWKGIIRSLDVIFSKWYSWPVVQEAKMFVSVRKEIQHDDGLDV